MTDQDSLVHELGNLVVRDEQVSAQPWEGYALVARFDDDRLQLGGFAYQGDAILPATPKDAGIPGRLQALREAMRQHGRAPWGACVLRIDRATKKVRIEFEYDHPERWKITPETLAEVSERARP